MKCTNIHIIEIPEGEEREKWVEITYDKIMANTFPNLMKERYEGTGNRILVGMRNGPVKALAGLPLEDGVP